MLLRRHKQMRAKEIEHDEIDEQEREDLEGTDEVVLGNDESDQDLPDEVEDSSELVDLHDFTVAELKKQAKERGLEGYSDLKKTELVELLEGE